MKIAETSYYPPVYYARTASGAAAQRGAAPETPIQPGELDIRIEVSVTFAIK